ncbi:MAG: hypothetical protein ACI4PC_06895 [Oscillospiraceae bacterium]
MAAELTESERVKELILRSKKAAGQRMEALRSLEALDRTYFSQQLTGFILDKYLLTQEDLLAVDGDFNALTELSLSKSMKISKDLVKEFDLARSCDGASSAVAKKVLLFMAIQKALSIQIPAELTVKFKTVDELCGIVWDAMEDTPCWQGRLT